MAEWNLAFTETDNDKQVAYINARLIDPESGLDTNGALLTEGEKIADFGPDLFSDGVPDGIEVVDCEGKILMPGIVDIQVHFREPGQSHKETLHSGSKSAVAGGVTSVVCQPNTTPTIDNVSIVEELAQKAKEEGHCNIYIYASISQGLKGEALSDMEGLAAHPMVVGFTDDGLPVMNAHLMRKAFEKAADLGLPVVQHAEDLNLTNGGCINEGEVSKELGVKGIPNISESVIIARDILILGLTGGHYHVLHVSAKESLEAIRWGKSMGLNVTCEVAPHHFALNDTAVLEHGTLAKMNPPLRSEEDRKAMIAGLVDGTFDAIATDHAPHDEESKQPPLEKAAFGIVGVETLLPLSLELYHDGTMPLLDVLALLTNKPADVIKQPIGRLKKDNRADLAIIDLDHEWEIDPQAFASLSKNTPLGGRKVKGRAVKTVVGGKLVYSC